MAWFLQGVGFIVLVAILFITIQKNNDKDANQNHALIKTNKTPMDETNIIVRSPAFKHEETIPSKYTCDGENMSPPIAIDNVPDNTSSIVLIMDDPDATNGETWDHWVVFNIPENLTRIGEGEEPKEGVPGNNSWGNTGYGGPCPPEESGPHRYFFKVYALDSSLRLQKGATKKEILDAMQGHIVAKGELMGKYARMKK
jgi:Raf kinase inhibitor-like YbhB/YbcL family protein